MVHVRGKLGPSRVNEGRVVLDGQTRRGPDCLNRRAGIYADVDDLVVHFGRTVPDDEANRHVGLVGGTPVLDLGLRPHGIADAEETGRRGDLSHADVGGHGDNELKELRAVREPRVRGVPAAPDPHTGHAVAGAGAGYQRDRVVAPGEVELGELAPGVGCGIVEIAGRVLAGPDASAAHDELLSYRDAVRGVGRAGIEPDGASLAVDIGHIGDGTPARARVQRVELPSLGFRVQGSAVVGITAAGIDERVHHRADHIAPGQAQVAEPGPAGAGRGQRVIHKRVVGSVGRVGRVETAVRVQLVAARDSPTGQAGVAGDRVRIGVGGHGAYLVRARIIHLNVRDHHAGIVAAADNIEAEGVVIGQVVVVPQVHHVIVGHGSRQGNVHIGVGSCCRVVGPDLAGAGAIG